MRCFFRAVLFLFYLVLSQFSGVTQSLIHHISHIETSRYRVEEKPYHVIFQMGYAQHEISNPEAWEKDRRHKKPVEVDLIFTQYPKQKEDWRTNYDTLLTRRIRELTKVIPELESDTSVSWNLILQTEVSSEADAQNLFHGAVVKYKLVLPQKLKKSLATVRKIITGKIDFEDSIVFNVFQRNAEWENMLIVNDWTGSMYEYGAQAVLWYRLNMEKNPVKYMVFFNDGNMKKDEEKILGNTGGIYEANPADLRNLISVMREVMVSGSGGDDEENDLEALLYGLSRYDDFKEVILIADNKNGIRDMPLLPKITVPVRVILCGADEGKEIHEDYLQLAYHSKGSIHTLEEDITNLADNVEGDSFTLLGVEYTFKNGQFLVNNLDSTIDDK
ncbi:hypothetical protein [Flexithrix dorotheae]|uniref:hypothetical protein n=1 Tax=Flexithrix dorotheae TaxID=70993 RepID=UPI0012FC87D2|nr:hypothetical protein [Flexithrix dorotheae]